MNTGTVQKFESDRGFGFIECPDLKNNLFFHVSEVQNGAAIEPGDKVEFEIGKNERGKNKGKSCARNIRVLN